MLLNTIYNKEIVNNIKGTISIQSLNEGLMGEIPNLVGYIKFWMGTFFVILLLVSGYILYVNRINTESRRKINLLENEKKYLRGLFVELNNTKENLRYFFYGKKWFNRIRCSFNYLFSDEYGKKLREIFLYKNIDLHIKKRISINKMLSSVEKVQQYILDLYDMKFDVPSRYKKTAYKFQMRNEYSDDLELIKKRLKLIRNRYLIILGSAGNGKTNLLCNFAEMVIKFKYPCIFLNAKEINTDIKRYFLEQCNFPKVFNQQINWLIFKLVCRCRRKITFVIIDSINENSSPEFLQSFAEFLNSLLNNKKIKVIVACRSEYFENKYKDMLVDKVDYEAVCENIQEEKYSKNAVNRLFDIYKKRFNFEGRISIHAQNQLCNQLLLMRMFFETHENSNEVISDLDYYMIYQQYINLIISEKKIDVNVIVNEIVQVMLKTQEYRYVKLSDISLKSLDIYDKIEGSILISKTVEYHKDSILRNEEERLYFVFDEMRDYCLSRYILNSICERVEDRPSVDKLIQVIEKFGLEKAVCMEGLINNCYRYYKGIKNDSACFKLLEKYIKPVDIKSKGENYYSYTEIKGWGMKLAFEDSNNQLPCEKEYIKYIIYQNPSHLLETLFAFLIEQEKEQGVYNLNIILMYLRAERNFDKFINILKKCIGRYHRNSVNLNDLYEIDKELSKKNHDGLKRFREIEILYIMLFKWSGKDELVKKLEKNSLFDLKSEKIKVCKKYYLVGENYDN